MKSISIYSLVVLLIISVILNFRLLFLWNSATEDHYRLISSNYFGQHQLLQLLKAKKYEEATDILQKETDETGSAVAIICMENNCL